MFRPRDIVPIMVIAPIMEIYPLFIAQNYSRVAILNNFVYNINIDTYVITIHNIIIYYYFIISLLYLMNTPTYSQLSTQYFTSNH